VRAHDDHLTILCTIEVFKEDAAATTVEPTKCFIARVLPTIEGWPRAVANRRRRGFEERGMARRRGSAVDHGRWWPAVRPVPMAGAMEVVSIDGAQQ
jgi:hypothetical protein